VVNWEESWKLITIDFGFESIWLKKEVILLHHNVHYISLLQKLRSALPNTVVLLLSPIDLLDVSSCNPLLKNPFLQNPSKNCRKEINDNAKIFSIFLNKLANEFRNANFGIEVIPSMQRFGKLMKCEFPNDDVQSKMGKFLWNNFISSKRSSKMRTDKIDCITPGKVLPLTPPSKKKALKKIDKLTSSSQGIEIDTKSTNEEMKIQFFNGENTFTSRNLNEDACFGSQKACPLRKKKENFVQFNLADAFEDEDLKYLMKSKDLSFRVESPSNVSMLKMTVITSEVHAYSGNVRNNQDDWIKLEKTDLFACSSDV